MCAGDPRVEVGLDGPTAMGRDIALFERGEEAFRVYTWRDIWVTLGRNQAPEDALIDPRTTRWVHRPTGGSAVLHGHDVTIGLVRPIRIQMGRFDAIQFATDPLLAALNDLGLNCAIGSDVGIVASLPTLADCFATTSKNDIVDRDRRTKICGCALRRSRHAILLQASIPVSLPPTPASEIIRGAMPTPLSSVDPNSLVDALSRYNLRR